MTTTAPETPSTDALHEMGEIQAELRQALGELLREVGGKLKPHERMELEAEFRQIDEVLERLKSGFVYVALFGKTSVGKSAIVNALLDDEVAKVGIEMDLTSEAHEFKRPPWVVVDVPGMMGRDELEKLAVDEAKRAHGIIFCLDGEPYGPEMDLFNLVHEATLSVPKIVFVNKWDEWEYRPKVNQEKVKGLIQAKMGRFVHKPEDIVYGSAQRLDPATDVYVRQEVPRLLDRMYEGAGSLGLVMNVIDPAKRAEEFGDHLREKVMDVRINVARKIISWFATASVASTFIPLTDFIVSPGILGSMVYTVCKVLGYKIDRQNASKVTTELLKTCASYLAIDFATVLAVDAAVVVGTVLTGGLGLLLGFGAFGAQGFFKYRRAVILGEVTIAYVKNNCSWEGEDMAVVIRRCREKAMEHYMKLRGADE